MDQFFAIKVNREDENPFWAGPSCLVWTLTDALRTAIRNAQASIKAGACSLFEMDATFRAPAHALLSEDEWAEVSADSARPLTSDLSVGYQRLVVTDGLIRLCGYGRPSGPKIESVSAPIDVVLGKAGSPASSAPVPVMGSNGQFEIAAHFVGDGESEGASPGCVRITDPAFLIEALQALSKVCVSNALQFVALDGEVLAEWGKFGTDAVDGEQMSGILLLVYREHFMFTGESDDGRCESDMVSIKEFVASVAASSAS